MKTLKVAPNHLTIFLAYFPNNKSRLLLSNIFYKMFEFTKLKIYFRKGQAITK